MKYQQDLMALGMRVGGEKDINKDEKAGRGGQMGTESHTQGGGN